MAERGLTAENSPDQFWPRWTNGRTNGNKAVVLWKVSAAGSEIGGGLLGFRFRPMEPWYDSGTGFQRWDRVPVDFGPSGPPRPPSQPQKAGYRPRPCVSPAGLSHTNERTAF